MTHTTPLERAARDLLDELAHHSKDALVREKMAAVRKELPTTVTFSLWGGLRSDHAPAESYRYHRYYDAAGRQWFVADAPDAGDRICVSHVDADFDVDLVTLTLTTDETVTVRGFWTSNPDALFDMTGVDVRDKCKTMGVVALGEEDFRVGVPATYTGVIHHDEVPVLGTHDRVLQIAQKAATKLGKPVYAAWKGASGGQGRYVYP